MFPQDEFYKYATRHLGMSGMHLQKYMEQSVTGAPDITDFTPQVIEERQYGCVFKINDGQNHIYGCACQ